MRIFNNKQSRLNLMLPNGTSLSVDPFALSGHFSLDIEVIKRLLLSLTNEQLVLILEAPIEHSQLATIPVAKEFTLPEGVAITPEAIIAYLTAGAEEVEIPSTVQTETLTEGDKDHNEEDEDKSPEPEVKQIVDANPAKNDPEVVDKNGNAADTTQEPASKIEDKKDPEPEADSKEEDSPEDDLDDKKSDETEGKKDLDEEEDIDEK